jgi:hypothetical protein
MMPLTFCATSPVPTFNSLYQAIVNSLTFPPIQFTIPSLPTIPNPIYAGFNCANLEIIQLVQGLQQFQMMTTLMAGLQPLVSFLGGAIDDLLPKISGTDLNLMSLLSINANQVYTAISTAIANGITFPFVPSPIFNGLTIPAVEAVATVKAVVNGYFMQVMDVLTDLIGQITEQLELPALPTLPQIPTLSDIQQVLLAAFPEFQTLQDLIQSGISVSQLFSALILAGFPPLILPDPLIPSFSSFEIEFQEAITILHMELLSRPLTIIIDFLQNTLGQLGFEFPLLCVSI